MNDQWPISFLTSVILLLILVSSSFAQTTISQNLIEFKHKDKIIRNLPLAELERYLTKQTLKIFEVHEKKERTYQVYSATALFDFIFGSDWRAAEEIVFICEDQFQPSIPVTKFLQYNAYFAFASADNHPFTLKNLLQNNEKVHLGPLYLVWDNLSSKELQYEGAVDIPYQIIRIELTTFSARFPAIFPPNDTSAEVQRGFLHFRKHCFACHTINGQGSGKATELNYPISVTEYIQPTYLKLWIDNPTAIRLNSKMLPLAADIPDRDQVIDEIIAYLTAMSRVKPQSKTMHIQHNNQSDDN